MPTGGSNTRPSCPAADYSLYAEGPKIGFKAVARKVSLQAGQQLDLGTLQLKGDEFVQQEMAPSKTGSDSSKPKMTMATFSDFPAVAAVSPGDDVDGRTTIHVHGRVVDSNGKPVNGATVHVSADRPTQTPAPVTAGEEGKFEIDFDKTQYTQPHWHAEPWRHGVVYATAPGFGTTWITGAELATDSSPELRLVPDDVPIEGQVFDLEGQPVPGAVLILWSIAEPREEDLGDFWKTVAEDPTLAENYVGGTLRNISSIRCNLTVSRGTSVFDRRLDRGVHRCQGGRQRAVRASRRRA